MRSRRHRVPAALTAVVAAAVLVGCGDDRTDSLDASTTVAAPTTSAAAPSTAVADPATDSTADPAPDSSGSAADGDSEEPTVSLPATLPTELVVTDLTPGTGPAAKPGDVLLMRYVGVRSEDGTEFDSNFDSGTTFNLVLGAGRVIQGWEQGLVGIKEGGRRQLDIPAELAYGDNPQGDVIRPGDALTFVVDAVRVISTPDPADEPEIVIEGRENVTTVASEDLVVGDGPELTGAETAVTYLTVYRADTGEELLSSWDQGAFEQIAPGQTIPGLAEGMMGMKVGGRREITIPFEAAFGTEGSPQLGLPANVDLVVVVELFGLI